MRKIYFFGKLIIPVLMLIFALNATSQIAVFEEDFESAPYGVTAGGIPAWAINTTLQVSGTNSYQNVVAMNDSSWFTTDVMDLTGYNYVILDFQHICKIEFFDAAEIFISVNNGATWTKLTQTEYLGTAQFGTNGNKFTATSYPLLWLPSQHSEPPTNLWWQNEQFDISAIAANSSQVRLKFKLSDGNGNGANTNAGWFLDDIKVLAATDELIPPEITMVPPILQDTAFNTGPYDIYALITDASGIAEAKLVYNVNGLDQDTLSMVNTTGNTYMATIPSFTYNNTINYYIFAIDSSTMANYTQTQTYSFFIKKTLGSGLNIALTATAAHSGGGATTYGPQNYNDDIYNAYGNLPWGWVSTNGWIEYTWVNPVTFNRIVLLKDNRPMITCAIQIWDGTNYTTIQNYNNSAVEDTIDFPTPYTTTKLRFNSVAGSSNPNHREIQVFAPQVIIPYDFDAGVSHIIEPAPTIYTTSPVPVNVRIKNFSPDTLHKVTIGWSVNGVNQTPYLWTGTLLEDQVSPILNIGSHAFSIGQQTLKVWTSMPNDSMDQNLTNDTLTRSILVCDGMLAGNYTIGQGGDYTTFQDAVNAISLCGIGGPVVFNVLPGTYNTRLVFNTVFPGSSSVNTVTFRGTPGAVIQHTTAVSADRAAIVLDGAKFLRFDSLTINVPASSTYGQGFQFINNAEDIQVTNCTINVDVTSTSSNYAGIVASGSLTSATTTGNSANNILIENNTVNGGYYGIIFYGATGTPLNDIIIRNNDVLNAYYYSLRTYYTNSVIIDGNFLSPRVTGGTTSHYALYVGYAYEASEIISNRIINSGGYGIYVTNVNAATGRTLLANNSVGGGFTSTGTPYGIYITASTNIDIIFNSVNVDTGTGRGIYTLSTAVGLRLLNNTFVYSGTGAGYAAYHSAISSVIEQDYNNYYSTGTNFVFYGSALANLAALQAVNNPPGNDLNSVSGDPLFVSTTLLLPIGGILNNAAIPFSGIDADILGNMRDASTPDIGAYEYTPVAGDVGLMEAKLVRGVCLSTNDSLYLKLRNVIGGIIDLSVDPIIAHWSIAGPVVSSGTITVNSGTINPNQTVEFGFDGMDLSLPGTYVLSAYIDSSSINLLTINDTLNNAFQILVEDEIFDASPEYVFISTPGVTVPLTVNSNLIPVQGSFYMTEICTYKVSTGAPVGGWPSYLLADDYIEITGVPGFDLGGYVLEIWTTTALSGSQVLAPGTIIGPNGTCILAVGQLSSSVPSPANYYYHSGHTATLSSTTNYGFIIKESNGNIVDAVAYGNYTFLPAANVTPADWTGTTVNQSSSGIRLVGPYTKDATNWINSAVSPQDPNTLNNGVTVPSLVGLQDFSWSLNGVVTSVNNPDTVVGPWTSNGIYQYVASYLTPCGLFTDTVTIEVGVVPHDLVVTEIVTPEDNLCTDGLAEVVSIKILNLGIDTIFGGFTASYSIDYGTPVTENVNLTLYPADTIIYTFTTPLSISATGVDTIFHLHVWATIPTDPYNFNDSLGIDLTFNYPPTPPMGQNDTVNYGQSATLVATSNGPVYWYADTLSQTTIASGDTLVTPNLYATTTYYAAAASGSGLGIADSLTTTFAGGNGCGGGAMFNLTALSGDLVVTGFTIVSNTTNSAMPVKVYIKPGTYLGFETNPAAWTQIGGIYTVNAPIDVPVYFECDDIQLPLGQEYAIYIEYAARYTNASGTYSNADLQLVGGAGLCSSFGGLNAGRMFNGRVHYASAGGSCMSSKVPVTAHVNLPTVEPGVVSIESPLAEDCSNNNNPVSIKIANFGGDTITSGLTASYQIDQYTPVTENVTVQINPGDTILYTFTTPISLNLTSGDSLFVLTTWVNHPSDIYNANDTLSASVSMGYTPPMPVANDVTINFGTQATLTATTVGGLLSWYATPTTDVLLDTGSTYITPLLYASTPYYVSASEGTGSAFVGAYDYSIGTSSTYANTTYYLIFDVLNPSGIKIKNIDVFPSTAPGAAYTIQLLNSTGVLLQDYSSVTTVASGQRETAPVDFDVPFGTNFRIKFGVSGGFWRNTTGATYPYTIPGQISITGNSFTGYPQYYYFFYNWEVGSGSGCQSDRTEVWAIVDPGSIPALDAGVVSIDEPVSPTNLQPQPVKVTIRNYGTSILTSVNIHWTVNGVAQTPYAWSGSLNQWDVMSNITIGTHTFTLGNNEIVAWTELPNGGIDNTPLNDTAITVVQAYDPLCGTYTIGGPGANFANFTDAVDALTNYGITCPVVFNVAPGTYTEQIRIGNIPGSSAVNTVSFIGSGNAVLTFSPSQNAERHVLLLDSTKNIRFENLTIQTATGAAYGWTVHMMNGCENVHFINNTIITDQTSTSSNYAAFVANGSTTGATTGGIGAKKLLIEGNTIMGGYYGIALTAVTATPGDSINILNNDVLNVYYYSIRTYYYNNVNMIGNLADPRIAGGTTSHYSLYIGYCNGRFDLSKNIVINPGLYAIYLTSCNATAGSPSLISNNFVGGGFRSTGTPYGLYISSSSNINIYNNSFNVDNGSGRCIYALTTATGLRILNNSFAFTGTGAGYAAYYAGTSSLLAHNYNNYYSTSSNFVYYGSAVANLTALQAINQPVGNDQNSQVGNPNYYSSLDLHALTTQLWGSGTPIAIITDDIDGDPRDPVSPCIGADEFTVSPVDAGLWRIGQIAAIEQAGTLLSLEVTLRNFGSQTLTSIPVSYSINGGIPVSETWTGTLASNDTVVYTFTTQFAVPPGQYTLCARTELTGDGDPSNDEKCVSKFGLPVFTLPYTDDFESTVYWYASADSDWEHGVPGASLINSAHSPVNVWATVLNGNYSNTSSYYLYTPYFDFSNQNNMVLGFWHWFVTENGVDGGKVQYTTNNGQTWLTLGVLNDPNGTNWYNSPTINNAPGFSGTSGGWQYSEISLSSFNYFPIPVQFRFHFFADAANNNNGWAIDDFTIYQPQIPYDAGVISIEAPVGESVTGGQNQVTVRLKNFGTEPLTSIPLSYRVMSGPPPVNATWTGTLAPGAETSFTFPTPFIGPFQSSYQLCSWTNLTGDIYKFNDTTCTTLTAGPANIDGSVIEILSPTTQTVAGSNVTVSIRVKNNGLQSLTNIPVQYQIDGVPQATESIIGTLAPGAETDYTFITTFVSPGVDYELCAKTSISGDAIISNDQICSDLITGIGETEIDGITLLQNIPNPATDETVVGFSIPRGGQLVFTVTNVLGQEVYTESGDYAPGSHQIEVNTKSLTAGIYYYSIIFEQQQLTRKMVIH